MEWKDEYSIGILEIDNQHKLMLHSFSVIEESIKFDQGWSKIHYAIVELTQLARMHFSFEEAMMRMYAYPESEAHLKEHQHFFEIIDNIERLSLKKLANIEMVQSLKDWLAMHMVRSDRGYAEHIFSGAPVVRSGVFAIAEVAA